MEKKFKFNKVFGLSILDRMDETFYSILTIVLLVFSALIFINSQVDYSRFEEKTEKLIRHRYKNFVAQLLMDEIKTVEPDVKDIRTIVVTAPLEIPVAPERIKAEITVEQAAQKRAEERKQIAKKMAATPVIRGILKEPEGAAGAAGELPEVDDYFNDIPIIEENPLDIPATAQTAISRIRNQVTNFDPGDIDGPPDNLFNYVVRRQGAAYLDVPEQLTKEPAWEIGWRDPEEIERVVHKYSPMIEYCFRKHTRYSANSRGYIKVAFKVSYEGYVIPESVRIINSTIRNKALEQCIKNYIRHWRAFKQLDESMGIAQVVQKFVFN